MTGLAVDTEGSPAPFPGILGFSPPPQVRLVNSFAEPFNNAVATARTCYSPRVVTPADVRRDEASLAQRDEIAAGIYQAGHHTTLQHAHFQFTLENVSRHFIWSFLHSHPYYNSEQVSQRYVAVSPEKAALPPLDGRARAIYLDALAEMMRAYHRLIELLTPTVAREYGRIFPLRNTAEKPWARAVQRRAQEVARYVLPLATHAHLYHTVSGLTLHRYHRLCQGFDVPTETRQVVEGMLAAVRAVDPTFVERMEDPLPLDQTPEYGLFESFHGKETSTAAEFVREFDRDLNGRSAKLVDWKIHGEAMLAQAV
jgi:thymidylate synthase ThyX